MARALLCRFMWFTTVCCFQASAAGSLANAIAPVATIWNGRTYRDLHHEYQNIFRHGNRNAASHLWTRFILERSHQMTHETLIEMFKGYCAVSGSPVRPSDYNRYKLTLEKVDGSGMAVGFMHYCCWPCVCDTWDFIKVDTRNVTTMDGVRQYRFAVLGNPCDRPDELKRPFQQPFHGRGWTTLAQDAPEVRCNGGELIGAPLSDNGKTIIAMFFDAPGQSAENNWQITLPPRPADVQPGRMLQANGFTYQDEYEYQPMCLERANNGYNSGMGEIFRKVAGISPIHVVMRPQICSGDDTSGACQPREDMKAGGRHDEF